MCIIRSILDWILQYLIVFEKGKFNLVFKYPHLLGYLHEGAQHLAFLHTFLFFSFLINGIVLCSPSLKEVKIMESSIIQS